MMITTIVAYTSLEYIRSSNHWCVRRRKSRENGLALQRVHPVRTQVQSKGGFLYVYIIHASQCCSAHISTKPLRQIAPAAALWLEALTMHLFFCLFRLKCDENHKNDEIHTFYWWTFSIDFSTPFTFHDAQYFDYDLLLLFKSDSVFYSCILYCLAPNIAPTLLILKLFAPQTKLADWLKNFVNFSNWVENN